LAAAPLKPPGEEDDLDENVQVNILTHVSEATVVDSDPDRTRIQFGPVDLVQ
jgi:hypothetical protein